MKKEKIIQIFVNTFGQIFLLTNFGRVIVQERDELNKSTGKWFGLKIKLEDIK